MPNPSAPSKPETDWSLYETNLPQDCGEYPEMTRYDRGAGTLHVPVYGYVADHLGEYFDNPADMSTLNIVGVFGNTVHQFIQALIEAMQNDDKLAVSKLMKHIRKFEPE